MGRVVVLGEAARVEGFALGGAMVIAADDARRGAPGLGEPAGDDVAVVVLTANGVDGARRRAGRRTTGSSPW